MFDVATQASPSKERLLRDYGTATENFRLIETGTGLVPFFDNSQKSQSETLETKIGKTDSFNGENKIPPFAKSASQNEQRPARYENTKDL